MRVRLVLASFALLAAAGCTRPPVAPVGAPHFVASGLGRHAVVLCARAESAVAAAEETHAVPPIDPAPYLGRPLRRAVSATDAVCITLDDGPSPYTAEVLDVFERLGARATFFWVGGRTRGHEAVVERAYREGFEIGNHTWDHEEINGESESFDLAEIDRCDRQLASLIGTTSVYVRPPAGHWDDATMRAAVARRKVLALWSLHGQDTGPGTHAATIARGVVRSAQAGDVILLHETNPQTVAALPDIIRGLQAKGLRVVTLSQMLAR